MANSFKEFIITTFFFFSLTNYFKRNSDLIFTNVYYTFFLLSYSAVLKPRNPQSERVKEKEREKRKKGKSNEVPDNAEKGGREEKERADTL